VQEWLLDAKLPRGGFMPSGRWGLVPELDGEPIEEAVMVMPRPRKQVDLELPLAPDLESQYRFDVTAEEAAQLHPKLQQLLSFRFANNYEVNEFRKQRAIKQWQAHTNDTGSTQVQIAVLSDRINYLTEHMQRHRKDFCSSRKLRIFINKRRRLLKYMREQDVGVYYKLLKQLNLRDYVWLGPPA